MPDASQVQLKVIEVQEQPPQPVIPV
jgi:hemoglobin